MTKIYSGKYLGNNMFIYCGDKIKQGINISLDKLIKLSPFLCWILVKNKKFTNLNEKGDIEFFEEKVKYKTKYKNLNLTTEIIVTDVIIQKIKIENKGEPIKLTLMPVFLPFLKNAKFKDWDNPEIYSLCYFSKGTFINELRSPDGNPSNRKYVTFRTNFKEDDHSIKFKSFVGNKTINDPEIKNWDNSVLNYGEYSVNCFKKDIYLSKNKTCSFEMELNFLNAGNIKINEFISTFPKIPKMKKFHLEEKLSKKHTIKQKIKTPNKKLNQYFNEILPLNIKTTFMLGRDWSGMRGTRDVAQDALSYLYINPEKVKERLIEIFSVQKENGNFPRQYSMVKENDERKFVDSGLWVWQLTIEYIKYTQDFKFLKIKIKDKTILKRIGDVFEFYFNEKNVGEHGLCKVWEGDWLDAISGIGLKGRGESFMVTAQLIIALKQIIELINFLDLKNKKYNIKLNEFTKALLKNINKDNYFNGYFCDDNKWGISNKDKDNKKRVFTPSNSYAIISNILSINQENEIIHKIIKYNDSENGIRLFYPPYLGVKGLGRLGSSDLLPGIAENGVCYNHGGNGFFAKALAHSGKNDLFYKYLLKMMPIYSKKPYLIVNSWPEINCDIKRDGGFILTGAASLAFRLIYKELVGIRHELGYISIDPHIPSVWNNLDCEYKWMNKNITINIRRGKSEIKFNGKNIPINSTDILRKNKIAKIYLKEIKNKNKLEIFIK